jgi:AcrR family transcriptional regulator
VSADPKLVEPGQRLRLRYRVAILEAARRLALETGEEFTTRDLVAEAGVALRTFYRHFPEGKDQVTLMVIADLLDDHCDGLEERSKSMRRPETRLRFYLVETMQGLAGPSGSSGARFLTSRHWHLYQTRPNEIDVATRRFADLVRREVAAGATAGVFAPRDLEIDAWLITRMALAVLHHYAWAQSDDSMATTVNATADFCLDSIRPNPPRRSGRH